MAPPSSRPQLPSCRNGTHVKRFIGLGRSEVPKVQAPGGEPRDIGDDQPAKEDSQAAKIQQPWAFRTVGESDCILTVGVSGASYSELSPGGIP